MLNNEDNLMRRKAGIGWNWMELVALLKFPAELVALLKFPCLES